MIFDPMYFVFLLPGMAFVMFAQWKVSSTFKKFSNIPTNRRMTGAQVAEEILRSNGIYDVPVERVPGQLSDHYDPRSRTLRLSEPVYGSTSVAAVGVAAHEAGHALQHAQGYAPLKVRSTIVPVANIGNMLGPIMVIAGVLIGLTGLAWLGVIVFAAGTAFALVTLPVEFNASSRAMAQLTNIGVVDRTEYGQA
ncbi:MAG: zinc metallopeptidase, partial [Chloroflexota bacterium]|nr:zinc metallopeptidase [Chloroflexota bacterium]